VDSFVKTLTSLGFKLKGKPDESNKMFFTVSMVKASEKKAKKVKWQPLKACIYKRR
jgi:ribosomal RNA-processing protein 8